MNFEKFENKKEDLIKKKYLKKADEDGFVSIGAFATTELRRQSKSVAAFLDGDEGANPDGNLGEGIDFKGESGNYSAMKVHIDDLEEFIKRVKNYYGEN